MPRKAVIPAPAPPVDCELPHTCEVARLFPTQGMWTERDYLALDAVHGGYPLVELARGRLEVLPRPTQTHQLILVFLFEALEAFTRKHAPGMVLPSGMRLRLGEGHFSDSDVRY